MKKRHCKWIANAFDSNQPADITSGFESCCRTSSLIEDGSVTDVNDVGDNVVVNESDVDDFGST